MTEGIIDLAGFNTAEPEQIRGILAAVLDISSYIDAMTNGRPYADLDALSAASRAAADRITWPEVAGALDRHPRIGQKPAPAASSSGVEAAWSSAEQSGVRSEQLDDFAIGNAAYEKRFGHIFLICAAGLSGDQMLAALTARLQHTAEQERPVVIGELRRIAALRLAKAIHP